MSSDLDAVYKQKPVSLWVEDGLTRAYLQAVWDDADFQLLIGGGCDNLRGISEDAHRRGLTNVFAVLDRDFRDSNRDRWEKLPENMRWYLLESFEVENLLLDADALAAASVKLGGRRVAAKIAARLQTRASTMVAWMACRRVLADLSRDRVERFPEHPKVGDVPSLEMARDLIVDSEWVTQTVPGLPQKVLRARIEAELEQASQHFQNEVQSGHYLRSFSGKELLAEEKGYVYPQGKGSEGAENLAKEVAEQQRRLGSVPAEISKLHRCIRTRVKLPLFAGAVV